MIAASKLKIHYYMQFVTMQFDVCYGSERAHVLMSSAGESATINKHRDGKFSLSTISWSFNVMEYVCF